MITGIKLLTRRKRPLKFDQKRKCKHHLKTSICFAQLVRNLCFSMIFCFKSTVYGSYHNPLKGTSRAKPLIFDRIIWNKSSGRTPAGLKLFLYTFFFKVRLQGFLIKKKKKTVADVLNNAINNAEISVVNMHYSSDKVLQRNVFES